jgi:hypothetical protein
MNTAPSTGDNFVLAITLASYMDTAFLANPVNLLLKKVTPSLQSSFAILVADDVSDSFATVEKSAHSSQHGMKCCRTTETCEKERAQKLLIGRGYFNATEFSSTELLTPSQGPI